MRLVQLSVLAIRMTGWNLRFYLVKKSVDIVHCNNKYFSRSNTPSIEQQCFTSNGNNTWTNDERVRVDRDKKCSNRFVLLEHQHHLPIIHFHRDMNIMGRLPSNPPLQTLHHTNACQEVCHLPRGMFLHLKILLVLILCSKLSQLYVT